MSSISRSVGLATAVLLLATGPFVTTSARAVDPVNTTLFGNVAIKGYDAVAYFEDGKPVKGKAEHELEWRGATWRFASSEHREAFKVDPEHYAPQYGGYCAYAVSQGSTAGIDPSAWKIVDGKLYLNYNASVQEKWEADMEAFIEQADENWPKLLED